MKGCTSSSETGKMISEICARQVLQTLPVVFSFPIKTRTDQNVWGTFTIKCKEILPSTPLRSAGSYIYLFYVLRVNRPVFEWGAKSSKVLIWFHLVTSCSSKLTRSLRCLGEHLFSSSISVVVVNIVVDTWTNFLLIIGNYMLRRYLLPYMYCNISIRIYEHLMVQDELVPFTKPQTLLPFPRPICPLFASIYEDLLSRKAHYGDANRRLACISLRRTKAYSLRHFIYCVMLRLRILLLFVCLSVHFRHRKTGDTVTYALNSPMPFLPSVIMY